MSAPVLDLPREFVATRRDVVEFRREHERSALSDRWCQLDSAFADHRRTSRRGIPVIALSLQQAS